MRLKALVLLAAAVLFAAPARAQTKKMSDKEFQEVLQEFKQAAASKKGDAPGAVKTQTLPPEGGVTVELPTWNLAASKSAGALASPGMPLSPVEISTAQAVFGDAVDYSAVRLVVSAVAVISEPMTWGDTIRVPQGYGWGPQALVHELVHVWQYQTRGPVYLSDSMLHQAGAIFTGKDRDAAYAYVLLKDKSFFDYTAEQQAQIVEDWYISSTRRLNPEYQRLIAQLKTAKAIKFSAAEHTEASLGLPPQAKELPKPPTLSPLPNLVIPPDGGGGLPQVVVRF